MLARLQGRAQTLLAFGYEDRLSPDEAPRLGRRTRLKGLDRRGLSRRGLQGAMARLDQALEDFQPDIVHVNDVTDPDLLAAVGRSGRGVMTVQDHRFFCPGQGKVTGEGQPCAQVMGEQCLGCFDETRYGRKVLDLTRRRLEALAGMERVTVLSRYMARELEAAGLDASRVEVIPPFVDGLDAPDEPHDAPADHHMLVGRLSAHKGLEVALRAASALRGPPLVVAGDGPMAGLVRQAAAEHRSRVQFAGWADRDALGTLLARSRSLWLPSLWGEPFGIVGIEALAAGVPVIASRVGGVQDWLTHERHGLLVQPGSAAELTAAADRLAAHPDLARQLGRRGRLRVERDFAAARLMDRLVQLYEEVAGRRS